MGQSITSPSTHLMSRFIQRLGHLLPVLLIAVMIGGSGSLVAEAKKSKIPALIEPEDDEAAVDIAHRLFLMYQNLEDSFDQTLVHLYSEEAAIEVFPALGAKQRMIIPIDTYKSTLKKRLKDAAKENDRGVYLDVSYEPLGDDILIESKRVSLLNAETGLVQLLVGPSDRKDDWDDSHWVIHQERYFLSAQPKPTP